MQVRFLALRGRKGLIVYFSISRQPCFICTLYKYSRRVVISDTRKGFIHPFFSKFSSFLRWQKGKVHLKMYQVNKKMMESILLQKFLSPYTHFFLIVSFLADLAKRIRFLSKEKFNATTPRKLAISKCYFYFMTHSCNFSLLFCDIIFYAFLYEMKLYAIFSQTNKNLQKALSIFLQQDFQNILCLKNLPGLLTFLSKTNGIDFSMQSYIVCFYQEFLHVSYIRINNWLNKRIAFQGLLINSFLRCNSMFYCSAFISSISSANFHCLVLSCVVW